MISDDERVKIMDAVVERLIEGESLRQICKSEGMPNKSTILRWMNADDELATTIARARELQADALDDEIQEIVNEIRSGSLDPNAGRVVIWATQWRASKMRPKKYGESTQIKHADADGNKLTINSLYDGIVGSAKSGLPDEKA